MNTNESKNSKASLAQSNYLMTIDLSNEKKKSKRVINFAEKLHLVLSHEDCRDAIAWLPSGRSFCITDKQKFIDVILPKYFKSKASFNSFERRLKTWGFEKIDTSTNLFIFTHETFTENSQEESELTDSDSYSIIKQLRIVLNNRKCQPFISWLPSGNSFCINHKDDFQANILNKYFGCPFKSWIADLKKNGFKQVKISDFVGNAVYSHAMFQMDRPELCALMSRGQEPIQGKPKNQVEGRKPFASSSIGVKMAVANVNTNPYAVSAALPPASFNGQQSMARGPSASSSVDSEVVVANTNINPFSEPPALPLLSFNGQQPMVTTNQTVNASTNNPRAHQGYGGMFSRMNFSTSMPTSQSQMMSYSSVTGNNSNFVFRCSQGMNNPNSAALQRQYLPNYPINPSLPPHRQCMTISEKELMLLQQHQMRRESMQSASHYNSVTFPQSTATNASPVQQAEAIRNSAPTKGERNEDIKLRLLKIDQELLRVKETKLLNMQKQLKVALEKDGQKRE